MEDTLNPVLGEDVVLDPALNPQSGDGNPDEIEEDFEINFDDDTNDDDDKVDEEKLLELLNKKMPGKNFKNLDGLVNTLQQGDIAFARRGEDKTPVTPTPKTPEPAVVPGVSERLLSVEQPLARMVMSELRAEAERSGRDVYDIWSGSQYFQQEAKIRYQNHKNKERVGKPGAQAETTPEKNEFDKLEQKFLSRTPRV